MKKSYLDLDRKLRRHGFTLTRWKGSHAIYCNGRDTVAVNIKLNDMVARRLIKTYNLDS